jgi:hypothetical protein
VVYQLQQQQQQQQQAEERCASALTMKAVCLGPSQSMSMQSSTVIQPGLGRWMRARLMLDTRTSSTWWGRTRTQGEMKTRDSEAGVCVCVCQRECL